MVAGPKLDQGVKIQKKTDFSDVFCTKVISKRLQYSHKNL